MHYDYKPRGVCCRMIHFDLDDEKHVHHVHFDGGCDGNLKGISRLLAGMEVDEAIKRMEGIRCGMKATSCPDQLSIALRQYQRENA